jgi:glycosyltransferase involved in cell wall biosynthesis
LNISGGTLIGTAAQNTSVRVLAIGNRDPASHAGGYERIWLAADEALGRAGHEVRRLAPPVLRSYLSDGEWPAMSWLDVRRLERHNERILGEHLPWADVVCWWGMGGMSLALIQRVRDAGKPAVGVVGDGWMLYGPRRDLSRQRVELDGAARWLFISEITRERSGVRGDIVHPGVDPDRFPPAPAAADWGWRLACIGRVSPEKGINVAVAALDLLPEAALVLDGPGPLEVSHPRVVRQRTPFERVHEAYAAADAVLFPVTWPEPWGLVPLEAMSVGRPVVATATGGQAEYLRDGVNSLVVEPGDPSALAAAVRRLAADPELRERLRAGGFETAARYPQASFEDAVVGALEAEAARGA